jgi:AcrR family transcriptional regulator
MLANVEPSPGGVLSAPVPSDAPRKRGRPRDPDADARILAAASSLILLRGYESMTVDEVAANAGVGKATVYRRWARKEDLAVAAMEQLYRDELPPPDTGSLRGDVRAAFASLLSFVNSPAGADYVRTTIKESMRDPRIAALYRAAGDRSEAGAKAMIDRAVARGEIRPGAHVQAAIEFLAGLLTARAVSGKPMPGVEELDALVEFVLHGIASAERTPLATAAD